MITRSCLRALAGFAAVAPSYAAVPDGEHESVVVTGSRLEEIRRAAAVEVVDAEEIAQRGSGSLADLLRNVPGLSVSQPGGPGGFTEVFVDGAESNFVLVMVDGVRMNDPTNTRGGAFDFSALGVDEIERIEIVRGPVSVVYGAEALAGVINVITRGRAGGDTLRAAVSGGSYGYLSSSARAGTSLGNRGSASLRASYDDAGEPVAGSTLLRKVAQADAVYNFSDRLSAEVAVRAGARSRSTFPDASGGPRYAVVRDLEKSNADDIAVSARVRYALSLRWSLDLAGSMFRRDDDAFTPAIASGTSAGQPSQLSDSRFEQSPVPLAAGFAPSSQMSMVFGLDDDRSQGRRNSVLDFGAYQLPADFSSRRDTTAAFLESWWRPSDSMEWFGGVRRDRTTQASDHTSSRLGAVYHGTADRWQVRASWGDGFKLPSFYALGDGLIGNPQLAPERATSFDLEARVRMLGDALTLGARGFTAVYRDLIDFDFATFRLLNRSRADIEGIGVSVAAKAGDRWHFALDAMHRRTDLASGGRLLNRPDDTARAAVSWQPTSQWIFSSALQYVGSRAASSVATGDVTLGSYARLDLAAAYWFSARFGLQGAVDNLMNKEYEDAPGFASPGRLVRIGFKLKS